MDNDELMRIFEAMNYENTIIVNNQIIQKSEKKPMPFSNSESKEIYRK
jgi:hypothetical protein